MNTVSTAGERTVTAFFDTREEASAAVEQLAAAGIPRDDIRLLAGDSTTAAGARVEDDRDYESSGFWEGLKDLFMPDEDRYSYAEGLRRGGHMVTVTTDAAHYEQALDI